MKLLEIINKPLKAGNRYYSDNKVSFNNTLSILKGSNFKKVSEYKVENKMVVLKLSKKNEVNGKEINVELVRFI